MVLYPHSMDVWEKHRKNEMHKNVYTEKVKKCVAFKYFFHLQKNLRKSINHGHTVSVVHVVIEARVFSSSSVPLLPIVQLPQGLDAIIKMTSLTFLLLLFHTKHYSNTLKCNSKYMCICACLSSLSRYRVASIWFKSNC